MTNMTPEERAARMDELFEGLADDERMWLVEYMKSFSYAKAGRAAGKGGVSHTLSNIGWAMRRKPPIAEYLSLYFEGEEMDAKEVAGRLAEIARSSIGDIVRPTSRGGFTIDLKAAAESGALRFVKKLTRGRNGTTVEMHDQLAALRLIGQTHKLFVEVSEGEVVNVEMTLEEWRAERAKRRGEAQDTLAKFDEALEE